MFNEIFSGRCPSCNEGSALNMPMCESCLNKLTTFDYFCGKCGFPLSRQGINCYRCSSKTFKNITNIYALYQYKSSIRKLLLDIKFHYNIRSSLTLKNIIHLPQFITKYSYIAIVPCFFTRKFRRFYHPANIFSSYISKTLSIPLYKGLYRIRNTIFQFQLNRKARSENVYKAFKSNIKLIDKPNILLVDDIFTTGSTVAECADVLKKSGAGRIDVIVLAK